MVLMLSDFEVICILFILGTKWVKNINWKLTNQKNQTSFDIKFYLKPEQSAYTFKIHTFQSPELKIRLCRKRRIKIS